MIEIPSTLHYQISEGKSKIGLHVAIHEPELPFVSVYKSGEDILSTPMRLPLRSNGCYLQKRTEGGSRFENAKRAYIEMQDPQHSWVLPLFYFAIKPILGVYLFSTADKLITPDRTVILRPPSNPIQSTQTSLAIFGAIQYLQMQSPIGIR